MEYAIKGIIATCAHSPLEGSNDPAADWMTTCAPQRPRELAPAQEEKPARTLSHRPPHPKGPTMTR